ncbi:Nlrc5 [Symbiodinium pilosum]|uniref:Nlrc5 protein n=1 Tax=Symbiodinium pilosum TaxID=2952 RepID=A0A812WZ70_SYMPI|nr:Nlrc5 [Symbiodinium pilosum]
MKDEHTACCHVQEVPQRERDNLQHAAALELAGYAAIFENAEPYLLDLYAAICHDASEQPSIESARQFWEHIRAQNPSPLPAPNVKTPATPATHLALQAPPGPRPAGAPRRPSTASAYSQTPRMRTSEKQWTAEDRLSFRSLRMGAAGASCLALQLRGKSLTRLDLSDNQLGDNSAAAIASLIHGLPQLKSILLAGNILGPAGVKEIANAELQTNEMLEHLALGEPSPGYSTVIKLARSRPNHITTEGLESLLSALSRCPHRRLASLSLGRVALRADAGQKLSAFLEADSVLTSLDVSSNALTSEGISNLLPSCVKLQTLDISETGCRGELIHGKLCDLLQKADRLTSLSIARNVLEPRPMRRIARSLSSCASLLCLNMAGTAIETEGVIALADCLLNSQMTCLRELDLSENGISEAEALAGLAKIIAGTMLQTLRLNRNPIGNAGVCQLVDVVDAESCPPDGPPLRTLELGSCRIGRPGATFLLIRLRENRRLLSLRLSDNFLDDSLDIALIEALRYIQYVQLDSNRLSHRSLGRVSNLCAKNRFRVQDKEPRALRKEIRHLQSQEAKLRAHKHQAAKDSAEIFVRMSAENIAAEELRQLRLGIMKSARQTEQKVATVEKTLEERREYLKNIKEALQQTAHQNDLAVAEKKHILEDREAELAELQARLRDVEAQLARRRAQHPKQVAATWLILLSFGGFARKDWHKASKVKRVKASDD